MLFLFCSGAVDKGVQRRAASPYPYEIPVGKSGKWIDAKKRPPPCEQRQIRDRDSHGLIKEGMNSCYWIGLKKESSGG